MNTIPTNRPTLPDHMNKQIKNVTEHHYGFTTKYFVEYQDGSTEWTYVCIKSYLPFIQE